MLTCSQTFARMRSKMRRLPLMGWSGRAQCPKLSFGGDIELKEHTMSSRQQAQAEVSAIGIDIGKNTFHLIGQNRRGKILLRAKVSRSQLLQRLANIPRCLIGMEAGAGAHHIARCLQELGHDVRLIPAQYVKHKFQIIDQACDAVGLVLLSHKAAIFRTAKFCEQIHEGNSRIGTGWWIWIAWLWRRVARVLPLLSGV